MLSNALAMLHRPVHACNYDIDAWVECSFVQSQRPASPVSRRQAMLDYKIWTHTITMIWMGATAAQSFSARDGTCRMGPAGLLPSDIAKYDFA